MTGVGDKSSCEPGNLESIAFFPGLLSASGPSHGACSTWLRPSLVLIDCPHSPLRKYIFVELSGMSGKRGDMGAGELLAAGSQDCNGTLWLAIRTCPIISEQ